MASSYAAEQGFGYTVRKNWHIATLVGLVIFFAAFALFALAIGFPAVAGIIAAYTVVILVIVVLFVIVPVYALDLLE